MPASAAIRQLLGLRPLSKTDMILLPGSLTSNQDAASRTLRHDEVVTLITRERCRFEMMKVQSDGSCHFYCTGAEPKAYQARFLGIEEGITSNRSDERKLGRLLRESSGRVLNPYVIARRGYSTRLVVSGFKVLGSVEPIYQRLVTTLAIASAEINGERIF